MRRRLSWTGLLKSPNLLRPTRARDARRFRRVRAFPVVPYPYVIYFRSIRDGVRIVRVLHSARRRPELREDGPAYLAESACIR